MLFSLVKKGSFFSSIIIPFIKVPLVNPILNEYLKSTEYKYMKNINNIIENSNKRKLLFHDNEPNNLVFLPNIFFLSLTIIINFFYSYEN